MSMTITPTQKILEIYNNSNEFQKLVFIEVLNDLLKPTENQGNFLISPQMILFEDLINNFKQEIESIPPEILIDLINKVKLSFPEYEEGEKIIPFAYNKAKIHFGKELRDELVSIGNEEINEIHVYRRVSMLNLEKFGFIKKYPLIENSFLYNLIRKYKEVVVSKDGNGEIIGINRNAFDPETQKEFTKISTLFGEKKIQEAMKELLELDFSLFTLRKEFIIELIESISGKKRDSEKTEFDYQSGILSYKGQKLLFKKGATPITLLRLFFQSDKNGLKLYDAHTHINQEHILNNNDYYHGGKETIESIVKGINRRIREKFPKDKFLEISEGCIRRTE